MAPGVRMPTPAAVTPPSDRLPDHRVVVGAMHENDDDGGPDEEERLHDSEREASLEHGACFVQVFSKGIVGFGPIGPERAQRDVDRPSIPVPAVRVRDEPELVDTGYERTEEEKIDEGDEARRALCGGEPKESVDSPKNSDHTNDEHDKDIGWSQLICLQVAINKVRLSRMVRWVSMDNASRQ